MISADTTVAVALPVRTLVGLIGAGIQRSLTPALHEEEARHHGVRLHYQLIDLDRDPEGAATLPALMRAVRTIGFAGLNITYPCKQAVIPLLDEPVRRGPHDGRGEHRRVP